MWKDINLSFWWGIYCKKLKQDEHIYLGQLSMAWGIYQDGAWREGDAEPLTSRLVLAATPCTTSPPCTMHHQSTIHHKPCTTSQPGTRWVQKIKTKWQNHLELFGKTKVHFSSFVLPCHVGHYQISYQWQLSSKRGCHTFLISHQSTSCGTIVRASASNCDGQ